jgi:segregation and condensation protein B
MEHDLDQDLIGRIVEAAIMAAPQPLTITQLYALFPDDEPAPPVGSIERAVSELQQACDGRGVELIEVASGFRFQVKNDVHNWVARLWTERQSKYTRATLETLALIAYRQPITRGEIEQIRGVAVSAQMVKALEDREWIRVVGHRDVPGKPALFGTTKGFLDYFGLKSLDALPPLAELKEIPELDPQLPFDRVPQVASAAMINSEEISDENSDVDKDSNENPEANSEENIDKNLPVENEEIHEKSTSAEMTSDEENQHDNNDETHNEEAGDIAEPEYKNE